MHQVIGGTGTSMLGLTVLTENWQWLEPGPVGTFWLRGRALNARTVASMLGGGGLVILCGKKAVRDCNRVAAVGHEVDI